jgi:hypothetical protein
MAPLATQASEGPGEGNPAASMIARSDSGFLRNYRIAVAGEGQLRIKDTDTGTETGFLTFVDLQVSRAFEGDESRTTAGFHVRTFLDSNDLRNGNTPSMSTVLKLIEGYVEYLPQGADGIHVFRVSGGNTWVAFGYGADERASFASFPIVSAMSTAGIGFVPNATLRYENRALGFVVDGSVFSPQDQGRYLELENQGFSIRARKGIAITSHLKAEVMASYANLYSPTKEERESRLAVDGRVSIDLRSGVAVEGLAEVFHTGRVPNLAAAEEATAWLTMVTVRKGRASAGVRYSRTDAGKSEWAVTGRYTLTNPKSRVQADALAEFGRQRTITDGVPSARNQVSIGVAIRTQKRR